MSFRLAINKLKKKGFGITTGYNSREIEKLAIPMIYNSVFVRATSFPLVENENGEERKEAREREIKDARCKSPSPRRSVRTRHPSSQRFEIRFAIRGMRRMK